MRYGPVGMLPSIKWQESIGGRKSFPHLRTVGLLRDFYQGQLRVCNIGEIEFATAVGITLRWGDVWNGKQIVLLVVGDQNTFSRLGDRSAKRGLSLGIVATCHARCVKNGIEVYPFYLRSLRNIRTDFIARESEQEASSWADRNGFHQAATPCWRKQFLACAPKLVRLEDRILNLPSHLVADTIDKLGHVCEWRPRSGIAPGVFESLGISLYTICY